MCMADRDLECLEVLNGLELLVLVAGLAVPLVDFQPQVQDEDIARVQRLSGQRHFLNLHPFLEMNYDEQRAKIITESHMLFPHPEASYIKAEL